MRRALAEIRAGVAGTYALVAFKPDWQRHFDVSVDGFIGSFKAALYALPAFILLMLSANHYLAGEANAPAAKISLGEAALQYARIWLIFPVLAFVIVKLLGLKTGFSAWVVVHNWAVFVLLHVQALIWALNAAGIANAQVLATLIAFYQIARLFVHWRVAAGALGLPWGLAAGVACIPLVVDALIVYGFSTAPAG